MINNFFYNLALFKDKYLDSYKEQLHTASFARLYEVVRLSHRNITKAGLLLGLGGFKRIYQVRASVNRSELGNVLVVAPTRGGKGLLAVSQLLTWPHSVIVNDIKGELYNQTAEYRKQLGQVYVIDPTETSTCYNPLQGRRTESDLLSAATNLLYKSNEGEGVIFTQRAIVMLTQIFLAGERQKYPLLPYTRYMVRLGLYGCATKLHEVNSELSTQFLDTTYTHTDFQDKFLLSCWGTLSARIRLLLTEEVVRCFTGSDFTARDIMQSRYPVTVYLRWPERDLLSLVPLIRLIWKSLIDEMVYTYDKFFRRQRPVLLLVDEAGRSAIPALPEYATTLNGRGISLWMAIQSLSQLDVIYGHQHARILRDNMDSQIYHRPCDLETADFISHSLGHRSGFALSESTHEYSKSTQRVEREIPLLTARQIMQMEDEDIIFFHRNLPPVKARRMDWRRFPELVARHEGNQRIDMEEKHIKSGLKI